MSISSKSQALDTDSVAITSSVSLVRQILSATVCSSHGPSTSSFVSYPAPTSESNSSDTESVHMMSPVSPCRQMSIDYPDPDMLTCPAIPNKSALSGQVRSVSFQFYLFLLLYVSQFIIPFRSTSLALHVYCNAAQLKRLYITFVYTYEYT